MQSWRIAEQNLVKGRTLRKQVDTYWKRVASLSSGQPAFGLKYMRNWIQIMVARLLCSSCTIPGNSCKPAYQSALYSLMHSSNRLLNALENLQEVSRHLSKRTVSSTVHLSQENSKALLTVLMRNNCTMHFESERSSCLSSFPQFCSPKNSSSSFCRPEGRLASKQRAKEKIMSFHCYTESLAEMVCMNWRKQTMSTWMILRL